MSDSSHTRELQTIEAVLVPEHRRLQTLPRHFSRHLGLVEDLVYTFARKLVQGYTGRYWDFYDLTNGGF